MISPTYTTAGILGLMLAFGVSAKPEAVQDNYPAKLSQYCLKSGGQVSKMPIIYSTSAGRVNGFQKSFCKFEADQGLIYIELETFASSKPSIAATYIKTLPEIQENSTLWSGNYANPSHNVCKNLGGTMASFVVAGNFTDEKGEADICTFGDGSMVSGWSLIYMANHRNGYDAIKQQVKSSPLDIKF